MSLASAIQSAQSALRTTSSQTAVVSRNIAGAGDPSYSRKLVSVTTEGIGAQSVSVTRAADRALMEKMIEATSRAAAQQALADGLNALEQTVGDPEDDHSPAALIGALNDAIQLYSSLPSDLNLAQGVVTNAKTLAGALNDATRALQDVRRDADKGIADAVAELNGLLADFDKANRAVVVGTHAKLDITDQLDTRDKILSQISELVGIRTISREGNDLAIYTDSGVTLFDGAARSVAFEPSVGLGAGQTGNALVIDGVPVTGDLATMPIASGRLKGLADLRDDSTVAFQGQLDEIARVLIGVFAESDQSVPATLPDRPGLFTYPGAPAMPGSAMVPGLAGTISVNASVDPSVGGSLSRLRDGGISDPGNPAYTYNQTGAAGYADRLGELLGKLRSTQSFDPAAGLAADASLGAFATSSVGWLEAERQKAVGAADYQTTLLARTSDSLARATGVNLDDEMSLLLQLERAYQASSKLLATVDEMLGGFIAGIR